MTAVLILRKFYTVDSQSWHRVCK